MSSRADTLSQLPSLGIKPLVSLIRHWKLALIIFFIAITAGIPVILVKGVPKYMATATLQIAPRYMKNIKEDQELDFQSNSQYRQFQEHQAKSVTRQDILEEALKKTEGQHSFAQKPESRRRTAERLREQLMVVAVPDTYMMQVSLSGPKKEGIATLINAVVETYLLKMREEQMYGSEERVRNLGTRLAETSKIIADKVKRRTEISLELGMTTFHEADGNPYDKLLMNTRAALADARNTRLLADARQAAFEQSGETDITIRSINENVLSDPGLNSFKSGANSRKATLLSTISGLSQDHPAYQAAMQEIREIEYEIKKQSDNLSSQVKQSMSQRYKMNASQALRYEQALIKVLEEQEESSARFAQLFNEAVALNFDIEHLNKEVEKFQDRLNFFADERTALGFVRLVTPAMEPELPFGPGKTKIAMMVLIFALISSLSTPVIIDLMNRKIQTVNEAEKLLGLPSVGWVIERKDLATRMFAEDQIRRIAASLLRDQKNFETSVFAFTGVKSGGGCSQMLIDIARALSQLGFPALIVEANTYHPDLRFASNKPGVRDYLESGASLSDMISPATETIPAHIGIGGTSQILHMNRIDRMKLLLEEAKQRYPIILVDLPPLLLSADTELLLDHVGQILLVVEANSTGQGELSRAARILKKSSVNAIGFLVNRIEALHGGGYIHELLVEFVTQRKYEDFKSMPVWKLKLQMMMPELFYKAAFFRKLKLKWQSRESGKQQ